MVRISKPTLPGSVGFIMSIVFFETISFGTIQGLIPLLPVLNDSPTDMYDDKYITNVPLIFSVLEFCFIAIGSIISDISTVRHPILFLVLLLWSPVSVLFYMTYSKSIFMNLIRFMAILKGIAQPIILSIGTQDYGQTDYYLIYLYLMVTYCAHLAGRLVTETILKIDIVEHSICGNMSCIELAISISTAAGFLGIIIFILSMQYYGKPKSDTIECGPEIVKIFGAIFVFIPFVVFWIFYQRVPPQLQQLPFLIDMQHLNATDMARFLTGITLIFGLIYIVIFKLGTIFFLKYSSILLTIGGILLGVWPIIASPIVYGQKDQYLTAGPVKPDAIRIMYSCQYQHRIHLDIPYFKHNGCDEGEHIFVLIRDQILVLRENNLCPHIIFRSNTLKQCFKRGSSYFLYTCRDGYGAAFLDYGKRDKNGGAVVCVLLQRETKCMNNVQPIFVDLYREPTAESEVKHYIFSLFTTINHSNPKNPPIGFSCQTVEPGNYTIVSESQEMLDRRVFGAGGVYYLATGLKTNYIFYYMVSEPYKTKVLDCHLIGVYIIQAIGQYLVVINGFYGLIVMIHPKFRTIAIGIWLMMMRIGSMVYEVQYNTDVAFQHGDLNYIGVVLIVMPILSLILQTFCCLYPIKSKEEE